jgi:hypothetical protein
MCGLLEVLQPKKNAKSKRPRIKPARVGISSGLTYFGV